MAVVVVINPSNDSGYYIRPPVLTLRKHTAHSVNKFRTILTENIWCFPKQHKLSALYNGKLKCLL